MTPPTSRPGQTHTAGSGAPPPAGPQRITFTAPPHAHRPSIRRRIASGVALAALVLIYLSYRFFLGGDQLRGEAVRFLEAATNGRVVIRAARFSPFGGITLEGVSLRTPPDVSFDEPATHEGDREIFAASRLELAHDPWALLFGKLRVRAITASAPRFTFIYDSKSDRYNWDLLFTGLRKSVAGGRNPPRTRFKLRSATVKLVRLEDGRRLPTAPYQLDADAWPDPDGPTGYQLDYRIYGDHPQRLRGVLDPRVGIVRDTPFVQYESLRQLIPTHYRRILDAFSLGGRFQLRRLNLGERAANPQEVQIEVRDATAAVSLPFGAAPSPASAAPMDLLRLRGATGRFRLVENRIDIDLQGRLNDAPAQIEGYIDGVSLPGDQIGYDLRLECDGIAVPEGALRTALLSDADTPRGLKGFFREFDPYGALNMDLQLVRLTGVAQPLQLLGVFEPLGMRMNIDSFPVPMDEARGTIRLTQQGIRIEQGSARHAGGKIFIEGEVNAIDPWTDMVLRVRGESIPLDDDLFAALPPRYQEFWRLAGVQGRVDTQMTLRRIGGSKEHGKGEWSADVAIDFLKSTARLTAFPYDLTDLTGRARNESGRIMLEGVRARHGPANVAIDGWLAGDPNGGIECDLQLSATAVPIEAALWNALPGGARESLAAAPTAGQTDLSGRLWMSAPQHRLEFDLLSALRSATLAVRDFPVSWTDVSGDVRLTRDAIELLNLRGRFHSAEVRASGIVAMEPAPPAVAQAHGSASRPATEAAASDTTIATRHSALTLEVDRLPLDAELRRNLPRELQETWDTMQPQGVASFVTALHRPFGAAGWRYRSEMRLTGGALRPALLPAPLRDVDARIVFEPDHTDIQSLSGTLDWGPATPSPSKAEGDQGGSLKGRGEGVQPSSRLQLTGSLSTRGGARRGDLRLSADHVPLQSPRVLSLLPPALREALAERRGGGTADLRLESLSFESAAGAAPRWQAAGELRLQNAAWGQAPRFENAIGTINGSVAFDGGRVTRLTGALNFDQLMLDGWPIKGLRAVLAFDPAAQALRVGNLTASLFGGRLTGFTDLQFSRTPPGYAISLALAEADLAAFLESRRAPKAPPSSAEGKLYVNLSLKGRAGDTITREGSGEAVLQDARVWKLPFVLTILRILNLQPDQNAFDSGRAEYYLTGDTLRLAKIDLQGRSISLLGAGTVDLPSKRIDLKFLSGPPQQLRVPVLTELLEGATRELRQIRVRGTLDNPRISAEPFRGVAEALDDLFGKPQRKP